MPDVSRTEIGRRIFSLQKEKNVEQAIEKIRRNLGEEWKVYSQADIELLKRILGDTWVFVERNVWEKISFAKLSRMDLLDLIAVGRELKDVEIDERTGVEKAVKILMTTL